MAEAYDGEYLVPSSQQSLPPDLCRYPLVSLLLYIPWSLVLPSIIFLVVLPLSLPCRSWLLFFSPTPSPFSPSSQTLPSPPRTNPPRPLVGIAPHCPLGPIALAACLQIGLCTPNHVIQEMSQGIHYNTESGDGSIDIHTYVEDASVFAVRDGFVDGLRGSGLGIEVDEERVREEDRKAKEGGVTWGSGEFWGEDGGLREW